jgi:hypothetical protein
VPAPHSFLPLFLDFVAELGILMLQGLNICAKAKALVYRCFASTMSEVKRVFWMRTQTVSRVIWSLVNTQISPAMRSASRAICSASIEVFATSARAAARA